MSSTYTVPLSVFRDLFAVIDESRHQELAERLRNEIHADLSRRERSGGIATGMGRASSTMDSVVANGDILFYQGSGRGLTVSARPGLGQKSVDNLASVVTRQWRYPGNGGSGVFAAAVTSVLANSGVLAREYKGRGK